MDQVAEWFSREMPAVKIESRSTQGSMFMDDPGRRQSLECLLAKVTVVLDCALDLQTSDSGQTSNRGKQVSCQTILSSSWPQV